MIFVTVEDVDTILGDAWTTQDKKPMAVNQANVWLSAKKFCKGLDPLDESFKQAGAYLAQLSANDKLYVNQTDGTVTEKTVKAGDVSVSKKFAEGQEIGKSSDMQFIDDILKPFLCGGVGNINGWVCK